MASKSSPEPSGGIRPGVVRIDPDALLPSFQAALLRVAEEGGQITAKQDRALLRFVKHAVVGWRMGAVRQTSGSLARGDRRPPCDHR